MAYAALGCFGVEYLTMLLGVSIFMRGLQLLNILAHFVGLVLTVMFYIDVSAGRWMAGWVRARRLAACKALAAEALSLGL
jgi:hypothetical protein